MRPREHSSIVYALIQSTSAALQVLLVKNLGGTWSFPGGKRETGETLQEAVAREVREEVGIVADVGPLVYMSEAEFSARFATFHVFRCQQCNSFEAIAGPEIETVEWCSVAEAERRMPWYRGQLQGMLHAAGICLREEFKEDPMPAFVASLG